MSAKKVLLKGSFNENSGYGNDLLGITKAFIRAGWDVDLVPTSLQPPVPPEVAALLTKNPEPPFDLLVNHADPLHLKVSEGERRCCSTTAAWTMWEYEEFSPRGWSTLRKRMKTFDLLASYDPVSEMALRPHLPQSVQHVQQQGGYDPERWPNVDSERKWDGTFRYCMVGALHERKGPFYAVEAFARLKEEHGDAFDAELHLKTMSKTLHPAMEQVYPGLKIHYAYWPQEVLRAFYTKMNCILAPSIGEGKNMPALEAQSTGVPSIATAFGGHTVWQHPSWSYQLDYTRQKVGGMTCARPSVEHLVELMWEVYTHRDEAREKGQLASRVIPLTSSWDVVLEKFLSKARSTGLPIP